MPMKCKIQWIDKQGNVTPDDNDAVGYAVFTGYAKETDRAIGQCYPICAEHKARMPSGRHNAQGPDGPTGSWTEWSFRTFEEQRAKLPGYCSCGGYDCTLMDDGTERHAKTCAKGVR